MLHVIIAAGLGLQAPLRLHYALRSTPPLAVLAEDAAARLAPANVPPSSGATDRVWADSLEQGEPPRTNSSRSADVAAATAAVAAMAAVGFDVWALNGELGLLGIGIVAAAVAGSADDTTSWGAAVRAVGRAANSMLHAGLSRGESLTGRVEEKEDEDEDETTAAAQGVKTPPLAPPELVQKEPTHNAADDKLWDWIASMSTKPASPEEEIRQALKQVQSSCDATIKARTRGARVEAALADTTALATATAAAAATAIGALEEALAAEGRADAAAGRARQGRASLERAVEEARRTEQAALTAMHEAQALLTDRIARSAEGDADLVLQEEVPSEGESTIRELGPVRAALGAVEARAAEVLDARRLVADARSKWDEAGASIAAAEAEAGAAMRALETALQAERRAQRAAAEAASSQAGAAAEAEASREAVAEALGSVDHAQAALSRLLGAGSVQAPAPLPASAVPATFVAQATGHAAKTAATGATDAVPGAPVTQATGHAAKTAARGATAPPMAPAAQPPTPTTATAPPAALMPRRPRAAGLKIALCNLDGAVGPQRLLSLFPEAAAVVETFSVDGGASRRSGVALVLSAGRALSSGAVSRRIAQATGAAVRAAVVLQPLVVAGSTRSVTYTRAGAQRTRSASAAPAARE